MGAHSELTESVIFQPVDQIQTSKSSWIFTTAIDFTPYLQILHDVLKYGTDTKDTLNDFMITFHREDPRYLNLLNMTMDDITLALNEIIHMQTEASNLIGHIQYRNKRSLLPLGGLFSFLFGTADQDDLDSLKSDVNKLYKNQMDQTKILSDIITITNVSRGLINENINKINNIIDTILNLNQTISYIKGQLMPLYTARRFMLTHAEFLIHHNRIRLIISQMMDDINLIRTYLSTFTTGKITPQLIDPTHLEQELLKIRNQLPPTLTLPEDPTESIWHYYKFLTVVPVIHSNQLILTIRIPLLDSDSTMTLYTIYNLPIYHPQIDKSLSYLLEGTNLAITKDNSYIAILTESEFLECTLAQGHFCSLSSALYHINYSKWCIIALFLKQDHRINTDCKLALANITGPQAAYLDQGLWAISVDKPTQMEIRCPETTQVKTLSPPITLINLQPACSAFSPGIKLPPYFKEFSKGFDLALRSANLVKPTFSPTNFRIWNTFNLSNISPIESDKLKKLAPAPTIPIGQLRAQIASFRHINTNQKTSWIYIVGGGSGSGLLTLIVLFGCLYWRCKNHKCLKARSSPHVTYTGPENLYMMHTREGAIRSTQGADLGLKTVRIQDPVSDKGRVLDVRVQHAFTEAVLDQLAANGADVKRHRRKLRKKQYAAVPAVEFLPSQGVQEQ